MKLHGSQPVVNGYNLIRQRKEISLMGKRKSKESDKKKVNGRKLTKEEIGRLFDTMHRLGSSTRNLVDARRRGY